MKKLFGHLENGQPVFLYNISCGQLTAAISDYGATLVSLYVPDRNGVLSDVVLGFDDPNCYTASTAFLGATVGRNANRIGGAAFMLGGKKVSLCPNEKGNNLHSGPNHFHTRLWEVERYTQDSITLYLSSPDGDQGFPGKAEIRVTYRLKPEGVLHISYDATANRDTVFNLTNHSYFNLAGHQRTDKAMEQILILPGRFFNPDDAENIPTGELRPVDGTPMDFRKPKTVSADIAEDYDALNLQGGYDHNYEVFCQPCAILRDPVSGREMAVSTDCPGIQFYAGNYLDEPQGKDGVHYCRRSGIALETQFYPDSVNHADWPQPIIKAGEKYHSETSYRFCW